MATDHVNGNGTEEPMDTTAAVTRSEHFPALLEAGLPQKVAEKLDELYVSGKKFPSLLAAPLRKADSVTDSVCLSTNPVEGGCQAMDVCNAEVLVICLFK